MRVNPETYGKIQLRNILKFRYGATRVRFFLSAIKGGSVEGSTKLRITDFYQNGCLVLSLNGHLNLTTSKQLILEIPKMEATSARHLILNLEQLQFLDSAGLGFLRRLHTELQNQNKRVSLLNPKGFVKDSLDLVHFNRVFGIFSSLDEALAS